MAPVHRLTPLPEGAAQGQLLVSEAVLGPTRAALQASSGRGRRHEGIVLWLGTSDGETTLVVACSAPVRDSGPGHVHIDETSVADVSRGARSNGLGVVCQVHSHPGTDTRHSDGDDQMILMPYNGMFSLVVGDFGLGSLDPRAGAGLHQYQDGVWTKVPPDALTIVPALITPTGVRR